MKCCKRKSLSNCLEDITEADLRVFMDTAVFWLSLGCVNTPGSAVWGPGTQDTGQAKGNRKRFRIRQEVFEIRLNQQNG